MVGGGRDGRSVRRRARSGDGAGTSAGAAKHSSPSSTSSPRSGCCCWRPWRCSSPVAAARPTAEWHFALLCFAVCRPRPPRSGACSCSATRRCARVLHVGSYLLPVLAMRARSPVCGAVSRASRSAGRRLGAHRPRPLHAGAVAPRRAPPTRSGRRSSPPPASPASGPWSPGPARCVTPAGDARRIHSRPAMDTGSRNATRRSPLLGVAARRLGRAAARSDPALDLHPGHLGAS